MAKKKEEVKEIETTEEKACACGEECKCKKGRARKVIVTILLILTFSVIAFGVGVVTGGFILFGGDNAEVEKKDEAKEETSNEDVNENVNENVENDNETDENYETYEIKLFDENSYGYKDLTLNKEKIKNFVKTTDYLNDDWLRKAFLEETDFIDEFKVAYVVSNFCEGGTCVMSKEFLNREITKVFSKGVEYFEGRSMYLNAVEISYACGEKICMFDTVAGGGAGYSHPSTEIVGTRKQGENTIYTLKEYDLIFDEENSYAEANGTFLCKASSCPEDMVKAYGDKMTTYEMTFDKNNRYVSSKKVK